MRNRYIQFALIYLSIQAIVVLESLWIVLHESKGVWRWEFLLFAPAQLGSIWILLLEFFPNAWAWIYVLGVRAIRRKAFTERPWSQGKRRVWIVAFTVLLLLDTLLFVCYRIKDPDVWSHVLMMGLALPLLFLPVLPKKKSETVEASSIQDDR